MRLIDADALKAIFDDNPFEIACQDVANIIDEQPTIEKKGKIIESEERSKDGEEQMTKMPLSKEVIALSKLPWFPQVMRELGYEPVVRCKDCRWKENEQPGMVYCPATVGGWVDEDWFCKGGERTEE